MKKIEYKMPAVLNQGSINRSMKKAIPKSKPKLVDRNNLWWNDKLKQLRKTVRESYKSHQKSPSE